MMSNPTPRHAHTATASKMETSRLTAPRLIVTVKHTCARVSSLPLIIQRKGPVGSMKCLLNFHGWD